MQTNFTDEQLKIPALARSNEILRSCVHCGFCTATCPTYQVLGDELDSPRGRIYLIKDMLENDRPADAKTVKHMGRNVAAPIPNEGRYTRHNSDGTGQAAHLVTRELQ